jgi:hypothetical protein
MTPAEPGNQLARKHGAFARFQLEPRALELAEELRALLPSGSPSDEVAIRLLSLTLAQVEAATLYVAAEGLVDRSGQPQPILKHLGTMLNTSARLCDRLGLTPAGRAQIGLPIAPHSETAHYDLTKLDDEELETLFGLLRKAEPD